MRKNVNYRDLLRCKSKGLSQRQTAQACGCGRSTVQEVFKLADERGIVWTDVADLSEKEIYELIRGKPKHSESDFYPVDFDWVDTEMTKDKTMTLTLLWEEYAALALRNNLRPYKYSRFCELYAAWREEHELSLTRRYVAGDIAEFDWAGQTMQVITCDGEVHAAYLFVACLPFSQMAFVKAYPCMQMDYWCLAGTEAFSFFGGVPRLLIIDNLRTGVTKHTSDEIVLNRTYREFAEYYNIAVIPHAPCKPRGKASVESTVGKIANKIRLILRDKRFFTFDELNQEIAEQLRELNCRKLQKKPYSRIERFEQVEKEALQPLPPRPFEVAHWSPLLKVASNYHVALAQDGVYYSLPYRFVGKKVEIRYSATLVEIFCDNERIASHIRNRTCEKGTYITAAEHRPKSHTDFLTHDSEWFLGEAKTIGPKTLAVIQGFLCAGVSEEQGWGWCEKLLRKKETLGNDIVEQACDKALQITKSPSYKTLNILLSNRTPNNQQDGKNDTSAGGAYALHRF